MPKFRRQLLAGLTVAVFASFIAGAQSAGAPASAFRDNSSWTLVDGVLTADDATSRPLGTRATLADSVTSLEFRAPKGASAKLFIEGRYAFVLAGNGDWQTFTLRFRSPRFDAGYNKT